MQRMYGVPVGQVERMRAAGIDIPTLARTGVEIFFTQVFTDGFFHADMHPGNIYVSARPETLGSYIALYFGIVGSVSYTHLDVYKRQSHSSAFWPSRLRDPPNLSNSSRDEAALSIMCGWMP